MSRAVQCILISINYSYVYLTKVTKDSKIQKLCYARYEKPLKNHPLDVAKNMWKRIPYLMQQHEERAHDI